MVSNGALCKVHVKLNEIFMCLSELPLTGLSVILFEDLFHLPPVKEKPVDTDANQNENKQKYLSSKLWRMLKYAELTEIMRQKNHIALVNLLDYIRVGDENVIC